MGSFYHRNGRLSVRVRKIKSGDGAQTDTLMVFCPLQQTSVPLDVCASCDQCESLYLDPTDRDSFLVCGRATDNMHSKRWILDIEPVEDRAQSGAVHEIMSRRVVCVRPDLSVETLLSLFIEKGISGAPVVDDGGRPIGMVSKTDLLQERFLRADTIETELELATTVTTEQGFQLELGRGFHGAALAEATVAEIMTPLVFSLPEGASVAQAAALMAYEGVHRAPVVSIDDRVVGIVSSLDVLRWLGCKHGFIVPDRSSSEAVGGRVC